MSNLEQPLRRVVGVDYLGGVGGVDYFGGRRAVGGVDLGVGEFGRVGIPLVEFLIP